MKLSQQERVGVGSSLLNHHIVSSGAEDKGVGIRFVDAEFMLDTLRPASLTLACKEHYRIAMELYRMTRIVWEI